MADIFFTITGTSHYFGNKIFERKIKVKLVKEPDNDYDKEAIRVELRGLGKVGYVANSPYTVLGESISAGRLYDLFGKEAEGRVLYVLDRGIVCELLVPKDWHDPRSFSFDKLKKLRRRDNGNQQQQNWKKHRKTQLFFSGKSLVWGQNVVLRLAFFF